MDTRENEPSQGDALPVGSVSSVQGHVDVSASNGTSTGTSTPVEPSTAVDSQGEEGGRKHRKKDKESRKERDLKARTPTYQVKLERVLGLTVPSNAALDCDPTTGLVAYPAGCTVVLLQPRRHRQTHVLNTCKKTVTCVTFSPCGRYLATGECGHVPYVRVWDLSTQPSQAGSSPVYTQVGEFQGHKFGVSCVAFSPAQKYVVSVGSQHDMIVNVWDWRAGIKVASNKFSSKVKAISFAENGSYFVTVGNRHVKFWYLDVARGSKFKEPVPLTGRSAILGEQRNNYFCDVACGKGEMGDSTFAITKSGLLCEFNNRRLLDKWVELRTTCANCLVCGDEYIFVGCAEGIIRCFSPFNLQFITTLPRTHYLGVDVAKGLTISHMASHPTNAKYPDTIAVTLDEINKKVTAVYNDHSMYIWDVKDIKRVGKSHSYLSHSACIWGVEMYPKQNGSGSKNHLPEGSFITCSSDDTMRVWNIDANMPNDTIYKRNIYSQELLKVIYVDSEMNYIKDTDVSPQTNDKADGSYDSRNGVRCIKVSHDGKNLASGDRAGNIRIHDLEYMEEVCKIEAHDAEVLCLEYCQPGTGHKFLSSASRDRLIHVFNVEKDYSFVQTLDDHSSAITSVRFYQSQGNLQMVSCGADRSIIFRTATQNLQNEYLFSRASHVAGKTTLYDMEVDHGQRHILTACQDRNIRVYNVITGKHSKTFKGSIGDDGTLIKVVLDQSGIYAATSCTDKNMCIYDYYSGECMATMYGHSELVTGLRFSNDGKYLITVSGDGCIFIWSLPHDMTHIINSRLIQQAERLEKAEKEPIQKPPIKSPKPNGSMLSGVPQSSPIHRPNFNGKVDAQPEQQEFGFMKDDDEPDYRFSLGQLPLWAKKKMDQPVKRTPSSPNDPLPKGRWAQRLPDNPSNNPITFKSHHHMDSVIPFPSVDKRVDSSSSKESSLEDNNIPAPHPKPVPPLPPPRKSNKQMSQPEFSPRPESLRDLALADNNFNISPSPITKRDRHHHHNHTDDSDVSLRVDGTTTDHDGDIEDYCEQDDESTENSELIYYPIQDETVSDFTVNAMDVDELRRSQRRYRKSRPERPTDIPLVALSPSQESDDDDDASTPSADVAGRTILSMLSLSTESVDRVGRRETFMKNTFESLESARSIKDIKNKNSISYKFNTKNRESSSKREELQKRIDETRKKLQSIGYKSTLRSSKSISDLSNIPEKDMNFHGHHQDGSGDSGFSSGCGGGMRRACSLSDLTNPGQPRRILPSPPTASGKKGGGRGSKSNSRSQSNLSRSSSIGVLNQSLDLSMHSQQTSMRPTIASMNKMTPRALKRKSSLSQAASTGQTLSLTNLQHTINNMSPSCVKGSASLTHSPCLENTFQFPSNRRCYAATDSDGSGRVWACNGGDIRHLNDDSSSEEISPSDLKNLRSRGGIDRRGLGVPTRATSERDLSRSNSIGKTRDGGRRHQNHSHIQMPNNLSSRRRFSVSDISRPSSVASTIDMSPEERDYESRVDLDNVPLSVTLVESVCEWVVEGCERLTNLWWRILSESGNESPTSSDEDRYRALRSLLLGASARATHALAPLNNPNSSSMPSPMVNNNSSMQDKDPRVVAMMQQYTEMLVNMVQQKMQQPKPGPS